METQYLLSTALLIAARRSFLIEGPMMSKLPSVIRALSIGIMKQASVL